MANVKFLWLFSGRQHTVEGGVPAGVNHRAAYQTSPPAMIAATQHFSLALGSDACILYSNSGLRPKLNFVEPWLQTQLQTNSQNCINHFSMYTHWGSYPQKVIFGDSVLYITYYLFAPHSGHPVEGKCLRDAPTHCFHTPSVGKCLRDSPTWCSRTPAVGKCLRDALTCCSHKHAVSKCLRDVPTRCSHTPAVGKCPRDVPTHCSHTPAMGKCLRDAPTRCSHTPAVG